MLSYIIQGRATKMRAITSSLGFILGLGLGGSIGWWLASGPLRVEGFGGLFLIFLCSVGGAAIFCICGALAGHRSQRMPPGNQQSFFPWGCIIGNGIGAIAGFLLGLLIVGIGDYVFREPPPSPPVSSLGDAAFPIGVSVLVLITVFGAVIGAILGDKMQSSVLHPYSKSLTSSTPEKDDAS
ncbi:MAG: hypothetical protein QM811_29700 [Pirellulales bacterium]